MTTRRSVKSSVKLGPFWVVQNTQVGTNHEPPGQGGKPFDEGSDVRVQFGAPPVMSMMSNRLLSA